jgi:hypothetical protein
VPEHDALPLERTGTNALDQAGSAFAAERRL